MLSRTDGTQPISVSARMETPSTVVCLCSILCSSSTSSSSSRPTASSSSARTCFIFAGSTGSTWYCRRSVMGGKGSEVYTPWAPRMLCKLSHASFWFRSIRATRSSVARSCASYAFDRRARAPDISCISKFFASLASLTAGSSGSGDLSAAPRSSAMMFSRISVSLRMFVVSRTARPPPECSRVTMSVRRRSAFLAKRSIWARRLLIAPFLTNEAQELVFHLLWRR